MRSICQQICRADKESKNEAVPQDIRSLLEFFPTCLEKHASSSNPIVLVLDSLDQLSDDDGGRELDWVPKELANNVYMILSTLPGAEYICFPKLQPVGGKSYTSPNDTKLAPTIKGIVHDLLDRVERLHGKVLVSQALTYIAASRNGLTEPELEDILSLDDVVLNDVYQYWTPPIRRLPPLLWIRIRSDIGDYLIERGADGARVINWYHRQFIETARERLPRKRASSCWDSLKYERLFPRKMVRWCEEVFCGQEWK
ncbi:hypothetical protein OS493_039207 [Desmophyllum pertusum]|uniref:NWD1/2-like winged helix-turn-helix domain-containing protein n=1 Tax=Desmophyllum pertusum TaxID=174260 RepID=A0A9W9Z5Q6_9CNID|nr:hypothetical protein OS493_039207 [Desmophyllum pertusum]